VAELIPQAQMLANPTRESLLTALVASEVVHLACHGYTDLNDPAASGLILPDHETAPLTVADISARQLVAALAYLSACDTARTSLQLANEAVHVSGGFHLAGYRHVIGTLWPVRDAAARKAATYFYAGITNGGAQAPNADLAAVALHDTARRLRVRYPNAPTNWAAHTHTGA
jgi:CHAT domain-containing protein